MVNNNKENNNSIWNNIKNFFKNKISEKKNNLVNWIKNIKNNWKSKINTVKKQTNENVKKWDEKIWWTIEKIASSLKNKNISWNQDSNYFNDYILKRKTKMFDDLNEIQNKREDVNYISFVFDLILATLLFFWILSQLWLLNNFVFFNF